MLSKIKRAFNQAAHTYNEAARVQHEAGLHLINCLPKQTYHHILDLGCGTGHTTHTLANAQSFKQLSALDIAPEALAIAKQACEAYPVRFIEADFNQGVSPNNIDLIFSNMAVHWANDLKTLFNHCFNALNPGGIIAFSLPLAETFHELKGLAAQRALPQLNDVLSLLSQTSFDLIHHKIKRYQSLHENTLACLRAIKQTGATVVEHKTQTSLNKKRLHEHNITHLTYNIGFVIGKKPC